MAERSRDWFEQAQHDLACARHAREGKFHEWACFTCQQAAEKALKALYQQLGGDAWGHSVLELLRGLVEKQTVPELLLEAGRTLDRHYIPTRYPNGWPQGKPADYFTQRDSDDAIICAEQILRFSESLLAEPGGAD